MGMLEELEEVQVDVPGTIRQLREDTARGFKDLQAHMRHIITEETGDLAYLLEKHGSIAGFFEHSTAEPFRLMEESIHNAMVELEDRLNRLGQVVPATSESGGSKAWGSGYSSA
jgi:hypothetical protein